MSNRVFALVVGRNGNIDVLKRQIGIAKGNDRNVDARSFLDGSRIRAGIRDSQEAGLEKLFRDLSRKRSGSVITPAIAPAPVALAVA